MSAVVLLSVHPSYFGIGALAVSAADHAVVVVVNVPSIAALDITIDVQAEVEDVLGIE